MIKILLRKDKKLIFFLIFFTYFTASNMEASNHNSLIISSVIFQYRAHSTAYYSLAQLHTIHKKKQLRLEKYMFANLHSTAHQDKKLITAYLQLQKNLNISQVIPFFYCHDDISAQAVYYPEIKAIGTFKYFHQSPLSQQMGTLLHEFRHVEQHEKPDFQFPTHAQAYKKKYCLTKNQLQELDADLFVATKIQCPICLQIYQNGLSNRRGSHGYATKKDFEPYLHNATSYCKAHAHHDIRKLNKALADFDFERIIKLDNDIGNLSDRMPPF